jgi:hypothetical protein
MASGCCSLEGCGGATSNLALLRVLAVHFGVGAFETGDVFLTPNEVVTLVERESRGRKIVTMYELSEAASGVNRPAAHEVSEAEVIHGAPSLSALLGRWIAAPAFCQTAKTYAESRRDEGVPIWEHVSAPSLCFGMQANNRRQ